MVTEIFEFFNQGWVGSAIGLIGVVIGIGGIYSYKIAKSRPKPSFQKSAIRILGREEDILPPDVQITFKSQPIERLTKTTLIIWNDGTEVLGQEDIVPERPVKIVFPNDTNILSHRIIKSTKDTNNFTATKNESEPHALTISFSYLDPDDGAAIELLHDSKDTYPKIDCTIKGIPKGVEDLGKFSNLSPQRTKGALEKLFFKPKIILFLILLFGSAVLFMAFLPEETLKRLNDLSSTVMRASLILMGGTYVILPILILWIRRKKFPKSLSIENIQEI